MPALKIEFDNHQALAHFASWLSGQGEQDYHDWMMVRESEEPGQITVTRFHYHGKEGGKPFLTDNTIFTTCGRFDPWEE